MKKQEWERWITEEVREHYERYPHLEEEAERAGIPGLLLALYRHFKWSRFWRLIEKHGADLACTAGWVYHRERVALLAIERVARKSLQEEKP